MTDERNVAIINESTAARVGRVVDVKEIRSPLVRDSLALWNELRGMRPFPARSDVTPRRLARFLRNITLFRVLDGGADIEFRIMGDAAVAAFGGTFHGLRREALNNIQPGMGDVMVRVCGHVARVQAMLPVKGWFQQVGGDSFYQEAIFFPLGADGVVDHVLCVGNYTRAPPDAIS